jgi:hypothetical protein
MKIIALVGVLLIALAGSALVLIPQAKEGALSAPSKPIVTTHHGPGSHQTTTPVVTPPKVVTPTVDPQLPAKLRAELLQHATVVVGTYDPQVHADQLVLDEARAGASAGHAGFLAVNLLDDKVAGLLTGKLTSGELLPTPGVLIYRRPGKVVYRFDGYLDRAAIAQAALNSR